MKKLFIVAAILLTTSLPTAANEVHAYCSHQAKFTGVIQGIRKDTGPTMMSLVDQLLAAGIPVDKETNFFIGVAYLLPLSDTIESAQAAGYEACSSAYEALILE